MRKTLILVSLVQTVACGGGSSTTTDASVGPDARVSPDAGTEPDGLPPIPVVAPCNVLGLPGPPSLRIPWGMIYPADIDGDGKLDVVAIGQMNTMSVYLGRGDATFGAGVDSVLGAPALYNINGVAFADLDGDGKLDLVVTGWSQDGGVVRIALGDGTGRFQAGISYPNPTDTPQGQSPVALADLDGDGKIDLVVARADAAMVDVRHGAGDGTFGVAATYPVNPGAIAPVVSDVDGDGKPDVIVVSPMAAAVSILRGNGDGTFQPKVDRATAASPRNVAAVDLNGDGKVDLVVRASGLSVLLNDGTGAFLDHVDYAVDGSDVLAVGDVTGDGTPDVVVVSGPGLAVLVGHGDGTLLPAAFIAVSPWPADATGVAMGDVNGDHALDVIVSSMAEDTVVSVLESDGGGGLHAPRTYPTADRSSAVVATDLDRDGYADLVLTTTDAIEVALGKGGGSFQPLVRYPVNAPSGVVSVVDVSGDGLADLVVRSADGISVLRGRGDGTFRDAVESAIAVAYGFAIGDVSGDGTADLVVADTPGVFLYFGNGDGTLHVGSMLAENPMPRSYEAHLAVGDLDGDGRLDVIAGFYPPCAEGCASYYDATVVLNRAAGLVQTSFVLLAGEDSLAIVDIDHDGKADVVTVTTNSVMVRRGNGDGTLQRPLTSASAGVFGPAQIVDLNGDGKLDVVGVSRFDGLSVSFGNGDGTFVDGLTYLSASFGLAVADIDRDGRLDLVMAGTTISVLFARCAR